MEGFQTEIQHKGTLRGLNATKITHKLNNGLGDKGSIIAKFFCINKTVIGLVRGGKPWELVLVGHPVEFSGIDNSTAYSCTMAVHVFSGGVGNNICPPLYWSAVYRGREGVVHHKWHTMFMSYSGEFLNIKNSKSRVGNGFAEHGSGIFLKGGGQLLIGGIRGNEGGFDAHLCHSYRNKVKGTTVNGG